MIITTLLEMKKVHWLAQKYIYKIAENPRAKLRNRRYLRKIKALQGRFNYLKSTLPKTLQEIQAYGN